MVRDYHRIVRDEWDCLRATTYYLDETTIGRIDFADPKEGLFKISYREVEPPYHDVLERHCEQYPGVMAEFVTPAVVAADGLRVRRVQLFVGKALDRQYEAQQDASGQEVALVRLGPDGARLREERFLYNQAGEKVGRQVYDGNGRCITEYNDLDDW